MDYYAGNNPINDCDHRINESFFLQGCIDLPIPQGKGREEERSEGGKGKGIGKKGRGRKR